MLIKFGINFFDFIKKKYKLIRENLNNKENKIDKQIQFIGKSWGIEKHKK